MSATIMGQEGKDKNTSHVLLTMWFSLASHITNGTIPSNISVKEIKSATFSVAKHLGQSSSKIVLTASAIYMYQVKSGHNAIIMSLQETLSYLCHTVVASIHLKPYFQGKYAEGFCVFTH